MKNGLDIETARGEVEQNRQALDNALDHLESKIVGGTEKVRSFVEKVRRPVENARGDAFYNLGLFLVCGFVLGSWLGDSMEQRRSLPSGRTEPFPGELDEPVTDDLPTSIHESQLGTGT